MWLTIFAVTISAAICFSVTVLMMQNTKLFGLTD
jgi:hypothetical protein